MEDVAKAKRVAAGEGKPILLLFTGSTWCGVCVVLEKQYLSKPEFEEYSHKVVPLKMEFSKAPFKGAEMRGKDRDMVGIAESFGMNVGQDTKGKGAKGYPTMFMLSPDWKRKVEVRLRMKDWGDDPAKFVADLEAASKLALDLKGGKPIVTVEE